MKAFVLSGGGSKGAFQVGVLKQLDAKGARPDALYGTSTGAVNAAALAFSGLADLEAVWQKINGVKDVFQQRSWLILPFDLLFGKGNGVYRTGPLWKLIQDHVKGVPRVPVTVTRVNLRTTELVFERATPQAPDMPAFQKAVLASASTPCSRTWWTASGPTGD
jgi:predicted acylesterase/phospholipase RssA